MRKEKRLQEDKRNLRRTILDAIYILRKYATFEENDRANIRITPMRLPSHQIVALVDLIFPRPGQQTDYVASLPTSAQFTALSAESPRRKNFDIALLDRAIVDFGGNVTLPDGKSLRWVQIVPAQLSYQPSDIDWRIIRYTVSILGAEERCYRWYGDGLPPELQAMVSPNLRFIDCSRLTGLELPPLKDLTFQIRKKDPTFKKLSEQKIADALQKFGMRHPKSRPRRK